MVNRGGGPVKRIRLYGMHVLARKLVVTLVGVAVLLVGTAMIVLPGPALIVRFRD